LISAKVLPKARTRRVNINHTSPLSMKLRNAEDTFVIVKRDGEKTSKWMRVGITFS
jgi:hypothetical protein